MSELICDECNSEHFDATIVSSQPTILKNGVLKVNYCNESRVKDIYCTECGRVYDLGDFNITKIKNE